MMPARIMIARVLLRCFLFAIVSVCAQVHAAVPAKALAVVVNDNDKTSVRIARYYQRKRHIPAENIIHVSLPTGKILSEKAFARMRQQVYQQTPEHVQFYALAWLQPYRVRCMSITSAMTFGFNRDYCAKGCKATKRSEYYNSDSQTPFTDLGIRPTMLLTGSDLAQTKALIERGILADGSFPAGTGYLVSTSDRARNVRSRRYPVIMQQLSGRLKIERVATDTLTGKEDVLFYFTGLARVKGLTANTYLPGAMADHLTSSGGNLVGGRQMSALRWLDAGATASYGTVVEPCAFTQKFPNPGIVIDRYTKGESVIEAYWKSVAWPGQGLFVGEPLAAPFARVAATSDEANKMP